MECGHYKTTYQYCSSFQLTETILDGANYSGSGRVNFVPCVLWEADGVALEVLVRGLVFFNVQFGVTGTNMTSQGDAICGVNDLTGGARVSGVDSGFFPHGGKLGK